MEFFILQKSGHQNRNGVTAEFYNERIHFIVSQTFERVEVPFSIDLHVNRVNGMRNRLK